MQIKFDYFETAWYVSTSTFLAGYTKGEKESQEKEDRIWVEY